MASLDLYDWEIQKVADAYAECNAMAMRTRNTQAAIRELGMRIQDVFLKAGFLVNVDMAPCLIMLPSGRTSGPSVEIIGRISDPYSEKEFDHNEKEFEVKDSVARGEKYRGDKERVNQPRRKG